MAVAALAHGRGLERALVNLFFAATETGGGVDLQVRGINLRLEFSQKALAFFFQDSIVGRQVRQLLARGQPSRKWCGRERNPFRAFTYRTRGQVGCVISLALGAGQTVASSLGSCLGGCGEILIHHALGALNGATRPEGGRSDLFCIGGLYGWS